MPKFLVETISIARFRYVVDCENKEHAMDSVTCNEPEEEFSQEHIGENIISAREISDKEYLDIFDKDNPHMKNWDVKNKLKFIHKVNYND